jgi:putative ABC transport system permease protein
VLGDVERHPELLNTVVVPSSTARALWGDPGAEDPPQGWVEVERGAGGVIAEQLALATSATQTDRFAVVPPPDPTQLRGSVNADLQVLFLVLAGVCLVVGMVGIANTTFVTVMERIGEIGLRRALGASRGQIALQFLVEAALIGLVGGLLGALGGIGVVVAVALVQSWTAVVPPVLIAVGPALGAATAVVAAAYPAYRGAATEPTAALRLGTS